MNNPLLKVSCFKYVHFFRIEKTSKVFQPMYVKKKIKEQKSCKDHNWLTDCLTIDELKLVFAIQKRRPWHKETVTQRNIDQLYFQTHITNILYSSKRSENEDQSSTCSCTDSNGSHHCQFTKDTKLVWLS